MQSNIKYPLKISGYTENQHLCFIFFGFFYSIFLCNILFFQQVLSISYILFFGVISFNLLLVSLKYEIILTEKSLFLKNNLLFPKKEFPYYAIECTAYNIIILGKNIKISIDYDMRIDEFSSLKIIIDNVPYKEVILGHQSEQDIIHFLAILSQQKQ